MKLAGQNFSTYCMCVSPLNVDTLIFKNCAVSEVTIEKSVDSL